MEELKQRLAKGLNEDRTIKIVKSMEWSLPVNSIEISFQTVKRSKMDVLMKMMLRTFEKAEIKDAEELSELLLVDPLFINDLIEKMLRTNMIKKKTRYFELTQVGTKQLETGIFISEPEEQLEIAYYSPCHEVFFIEKIKNKSPKEQKVYRYAKIFADWTASSLEDVAVLKALQAKGIETNIGNVQVVIAGITATMEVAIEQIPCIEFRIHNTEEDVVYARVWNTQLAEWDETLEAQLNENERLEWLNELRE